jgi:membrane-associated phospholipid phosphatase
VLQTSYYSLAAQFVAPLAILGFYYRDRDALWEYTFNFHICLVITLAGLALLPAACAFTYYGFESLIDQTRFIAHFEALRAGTFKTLQLRELEGLITFPSFHVAGGLMVTWAFRRYRRMFLALAVLNALMIASTVLLGPHYAVDILASLVVFAASEGMYIRWGRRLAASGVMADAARRRETDELLRAG